MKNLSFALILLLFVSSLLGCTNTAYTLELLHSTDYVKEIKIVEMKKEFILTSEDYSLLKEIAADDFTNIINDIQSIDYKILIPSPGAPSGTVILIVYENDEYEIISKSGPKQYKYSEKEGRVMEYLSFYHCCDNVLFDQMIEKWLYCDEATNS